MAWFLALQGPSHTSHQSLVDELQDAVEVDKIAQELVSSATLDFTSCPTKIGNSS